MSQFVLLPALLLAIGNDFRADAPSIDGTWLATSAELGGVTFPDAVAASIKLTIKNGTYEVLAESPDRGTVSYDTSTDPRSMDITGTDGPNKGKTFKAIYALMDDRLTVCYDLSGASRPKGFKTMPGTKLFLVRYTRQKP